MEGPGEDRWRLTPRPAASQRGLVRVRDRNVWVILGATLLLGIAYGVSVSLVALHLDSIGFGKVAIGQLAAAFALGIVTLAVPVGALVKRVSAKRTLLVAVAGYALAVSIFPLLRGVPLIAVDRFADGAFSAGVWVSSETMLLARAEKEHKAFVMSLYAIALSIGYVVGPLLARGLTAVAPMGDGFLASGVLAALAATIVLVWLRDLPRGAAAEAHGAEAASDAAKGEPGAAEVPVGRLLARIKCSCFATFAYGYFQASVVLFLPLFLIEAKGISREKTVILPAFFAFGMLLFSNVAGRIGDRLGHLLVMRTIAFVGMLMVLGFVFLDAFGFMCGAVFVAGACLASISPLSLALLGVAVPGPELPRANAMYNVAYAAGMLVGPPISSFVYERAHGAAMLFHLAALWAVFVVFTWVFASDDPARARHAARLSHAA